MSSDTWGNGPSSSNLNDTWNGDDGSANNWNEGGNTGGFDSGAQQTNGFDGAEADGTRGSGACYNCGEEGHMKTDCPNPRVNKPFDGECRVCNETGHRAADCPSKPPKACKQCGQENPDHEIQDCKVKLIDDSGIPAVSEQEAWLTVKEASVDRDIDDFKDAIKLLAKAKNYEITYLALEEELRKRGLKFFLVALEKEVSLGYTNVDLNKTAGKKYTVGVFRSAACPRPILMASWPKDAAENLERLADAGIPLESGVVICSNCMQAGHSRKNCDQESTKPDPVQAVCTNCGAQGHRLRDCDQERPEKKERGPRTCRYCESEDHIAKECPDKDAKTECRNCYQLGHRSNDCTNEKVLKCDNCDEMGHLRRECPKPRDWSRVKCRHCGEMGHGSEKMCDPEKKAAFQAAKEQEDNDKNGGDGFDAGASGGDFGGASEWNTGTSADGLSSGPAGWESKTEPIAAGGGGGW